MKRLLLTFAIFSPDIVYYIRQKAADIAQNVRVAYDGEVVTTVRYGDEDVDFRVKLQKQYSSQVVIAQIAEHFNLDKDYPGIRLDFGGEARESEESMKGLFVAFGLAIINEDIRKLFRKKVKC